MTSVHASPAARFRRAYAEQRAAEGRGAGGTAELLALPYLRSGPTAWQWRIRCRTFDRFLRTVVAPMTGDRHHALRVLDLGAGNGWLCYRLARLGHRPIAIDVRCDDVDGLGAGRAYDAVLPRPFQRIAASFDSLPLLSDCADLVVFNASLHYSPDLSATVSAARTCVRTGGRIAILDSPFYHREEDGAAMVREKRRGAARLFGERANDLAGLVFVEFLTPDRLAQAAPDLRWKRHRVLYPPHYELRQLRARLLRRRTPSRFDLWECTVP